MPEYAIHIDQVTKIYQLYNRRSDRVKETFHPFRKRYSRPFVALNDVTFAVEKRASLGIIGRNGSGKSTLLQVICGILRPNSGSVSVHGRVSALLELGAGFNPEFTGVENVHLNASILGFSSREIEEKFDAIAAFADIGDFIHQPVKTYSSGMYVRLAFAIAVHVDPEVLIIDEALGVGDIFFQQKCVQHMRNLMERCTKVIVTHDMHAVANMCERVIVLDQGRIIYEGMPIKAIEMYTRLIHDEVYQADKRGGEVEASIPGVEDPWSNTEDWVEVPSSSVGGAGDITIQRVKITDPDGKPVEVVKAGDGLLLQLVVRASATREHIIFGYTIKDRVGNAIFGENTCNDAHPFITLAEGVHHVQLEIRWPEIYPQEYTVTFGVGEGDHPLRHKIQCWAHNILSISSISPETCIHAIFNNPIHGVRISRISPGGAG